MFLLLPPSEGKAPGGTGRWVPSAGAFPALAKPRMVVARALAAAVAGDSPAVAPAKLLGAHGPLLDRAVDATVRVAARRAPALAAHERYSGVVWEHLAPASLDAHLLARVLVPSGLLGVTTALDPVPDHRCKLSVSVPGVGRLDRWWRPQVTEALASACAGADVVDLLPREHAAAIDFDALGLAANVVHVRFVDHGGAAVGHDAKAVKGRFARHLLTAGLDAASSFADPCWSARRAGGTITVARR